MRRTTLKYQKSTGLLFQGNKKVGEAIIKDGAMFCHFEKEFDTYLIDINALELIE